MPRRQTPEPWVFTILVVDDRPSILAFCKEELEQEGYRVQCASTGKEALELLEAEVPSAVVLDIHLGAEDGWDVLGRLKSARPGTAVILFTAYPEAYASDPRVGQADAFVPKTPDLGELKQALGRLLGAP